MESNASHSETSHTLAGSAAKTARSLSADNIFDKTARELLTTSPAEGQTNSSTSDEEVHTSGTALGESSQSEEETASEDEAESLDEKLDKYLDSTDDNSSTEEEAEQEV